MGCDLHYIIYTSYSNDFNPRTRMGCDLLRADVVKGEIISIHAPAWGATQLGELDDASLQFQSTHPHGVRHFHVYSVYNGIQFQSTHPHGVRHRSVAFQHCSKKFQSTHPHGVRLTARPGLRRHLIFQSTHPHGVRRAPGASLYSQIYDFNPRTRMGCD